jgi:hypothetical protein
MKEYYQEEETQEDELTRKKKLLQREIVDGNYNKDQFIDYCQALKPYGDDLSLWSYDELKSAVNSFISYHQQEDLREKEEQQMKNQYQIQRNQMENQMNQINKNIFYNNTNNINNSINNQSINNNFKISKKYNIDCKKLEKSLLSDKKVTITIKNPKAVETSIFKSNYISYEVFTDITQWQVIRRYSDFDWLRQTLKKIHPGLYCPPLPGKKMGSRRFDNDFVIKRMKYLNKFLNDLVENEIYKASEILISFLSINDREQFEFKKKSFDSMKSPMRIEDYYSLSGKITLLEDDYNEMNYTNIQNYIKLQTQLLDRMNYNLKNYISNISSACNNLEDIEKDFEMLTQLNKIVTMKEEITKTYEELTIFFKNWKRILHNQNDLINNNIRYFFKYISMENNAFNELIQERLTKKEEYSKEMNKLNKKKEDLWNSRDINKWDITNYDNIDRYLLVKDKEYAFSKMCTSETIIVNNLHNQLNFANYTNTEQLKIIIKIDRERFINNIKLFAKDFYITLNDSLNTLSELGSLVK